MPDEEVTTENQAPEALKPTDAPKPTPKPSDLPKKSETDGKGLTAEERAELDRLRAIHADEKKWESRNKANLGKLRDLALELGVSREDFNPAEFDPRAEFNKLRAEIESERTERSRVEIAAAVGVPKELIQGKTADEMQASATALLEWAKANGKAPDQKQSLPPASEVQGYEEIKGDKKVTASEYNAITDPNERRRLREAGLVEGFGAPKRR
jgi:hypothetical protein